MTDSLSPVELIAEALRQHEGTHAADWTNPRRHFCECGETFDVEDGFDAHLASVIQAAIRSWPAVTQAQLIGGTAESAWRVVFDDGSGHTFEESEEAIRYALSAPDYIDSTATVVVPSERVVGPWRPVPAQPIVTFPEGMFHFQCWENRHGDPEAPGGVDGREHPAWARHKRGTNHSGEFCLECGDAWPCDIASLLVRVETAEADARHLRSALAQEINDHEAAERERDEAQAALGAEQTAMHADLSELLTVLGMGTHARPESPHEVMQQCIAAVRAALTPPGDPNA